MTDFEATCMHLSLVASLSLSLSPVAPTLGHRASVKCLLSLHFPNPRRIGRAHWTGHQPVARPLHTQTQTGIHALSGIRTHYPIVHSDEDSSCLRLWSANNSMRIVSFRAIWQRNYYLLFLRISVSCTHIILKSKFSSKFNVFWNFSHPAKCPWMKEMWRSLKKCQFIFHSIRKYVYR
jgi:hypothetical protein